MSDTSLKRFWAKVVKPNDSCWFWTAYVDPAGYGRIHIEKIVVYAHRYSYEVHFGQIPKEMNITHSCHNRNCVRPDHLSVDTQAGNIRDRSVRFSQDFQTKELTIQILEMSLRGLNKSEIAKELQMNKTTIRKIIARATRDC